MALYICEYWKSCKMPDKKGYKTCWKGLSMGGKVNCLNGSAPVKLILKPMRREEKPMKYRLIKPISVIALRREPEVGDVELLSAIDEFGSTIYCNTPCEAPQKLIEYCERTSCRIRALIRMGYLEEIKEEVTYHIGQRLERRGEEYIISRREDRETMHLTCLEDGNIWSRIRCDVINTRRITQEEFNVMTNNKSNEFTPIEDT